MILWGNEERSKHSLDHSLVRERLRGEIIKSLSITKEELKGESVPKSGIERRLDNLAYSSHFDFSNSYTSKHVISGFDFSKYESVEETPKSFDNLIHQLGNKRFDDL